MGLKRDVVVLNEYTIRLPSKRKSGRGNYGSRGGSPGDYVTQYMARELATETLAPIRRHRTDDFVVRYMARESATESLDIRDRTELKRTMAKAQGAGGVAFGYGQVSLSHEQLISASKDIQHLFDSGHTVMKTVLSFDQEYLRKHGLIPRDFVCENRGDYRGHLDQMKLRLALMHGLRRMGRTLYDDLRYVGVIQIDTEHVHAHLAMVDAGHGTLAADGTQRGKIGDRAKSLLRRGIDSWLDEKQVVKHLASAVGYERRNVVTFVKRWAHQQMLRESLPQFLIACLPEDRRLWRAGTNNAAMRKPNLIVHQIVEEVLDREDSPMNQAMTEVRSYANHRRREEGLSTEEWQKLIDTGRSQIVERAVNAVYGLVRQLPADALQVRTPMLDVMGMDYDALAEQAHQEEQSDDLLGFSFRLRSFSARLDHHNEQRARYHELVREWEITNSLGQASDGSRALYAFWRQEEMYQAKCAAKYRGLINVVPSTSSWYRDWNDVAEYGERVISLESMRRDQSLRRTKDLEEAERLGREIYGQPGGKLVAQGDDQSLSILEARVRRMRQTYKHKVDDLKVRLAGKGLRLTVEGDPATGRDTAVISAGAEYPFEEVKGLDLHHMRYDFSQDVEIGAQVFAGFARAARERSRTLEDAMQYLVDSGQAEEVSELPIADVRMMQRLSEQISESDTPILPSHVAELARKKQLVRRSRTVELGSTLANDLKREIDRVVTVPLLVNEQELG